MPKPLLGLKKKSSKGKGSRYQPATTSAKRHKSGLRPTPFTSLVTGKPFFYDDSTADEMNYITCTPLQQDNQTAPAMPISAVEYIKNAVSTFAEHFYDLLDAGESWIVIYKLDLDKYETLYNFLNPGLITIPRTKVTVHFASDWIENLIMEALEDNEMPSDNDCASSSSEEEPHSQEPPWIRKSSTKSHSRAVVTELMDCEQAVAPTSKSALPATRKDPPTVRATQPTTTMSQPCPTPVTTGPVFLTIGEKAPETTLQPTPTTSSQSALKQPTDAEQLDTEPLHTPRHEQTMAEVISVISGEPVKDRPTPPKTVQPRRVRTVYSAIDFEQLTVVVPKVDRLTVLFRPTQPDTSLHKSNPFKVNADTEALGAAVHGSRNIRDGGLALDFLPNSNLDPLLVMTTLAGIPVTASLPASKKNSAQGVICGVHWEIPEAQIMSELRTDPQTEILEVKRMAKPGMQSWTVKVTFASDQTPTRAFLAGRSHRIRPYENRPLQCFRCGIFGHAARVCRSSKEHCWTCSGEHPASECPNKAEPKCRNCDGPHPVDSPFCPSRRFQVKVAEVKASENVPYKTARVAVSKAVRSYATALKGTSKPTTDRPPAGGKTPTATVTQQPRFKPSTPHHRPPTDPSTMQSLFKSLISILVAAAATANFNEAMQEILRLFQTTFPGAESQFCLPN